MVTRTITATAVREIIRDLDRTKSELAGMRPYFPHPIGIYLDCCVNIAENRIDRARDALLAASCVDVEVVSGDG